MGAQTISAEEVNTYQNDNSAYSHIRITGMGKRIKDEGRRAWWVRNMTIYRCLK